MIKSSVTLLEIYMLYLSNTDEMSSRDRLDSRDDIIIGVNKANTESSMSIAVINGNHQQH